MADLSGKLIKGYHLQQRLGQGGFGTVYQARQTSVARDVAVKVIHPQYANRPDFIRRFETEAQTIARLEHIHIAPLYDYWRDAQGTYLVMRYLRGGNLRDVIEKDGALDLATANQILQQIATALEAAHERQVIHRDLKPENILLDEEGNAYLADFGIAKDLNLADGPTAAEEIVGSRDYISPEQARTEPVTVRTDVYSLGVVLYEMLTGSHPWPELSSVERMYKHIDEPLPEIDQLDCADAKAANKIIQKATAKNPEGRYATPLLLATAFQEEVVGADPLGNSLVARLTPREQEVLQAIIAGNSNREIAEALFIEVSTVRFHIRQLYRKLGVKSRVQAIVKARDLHLITADRDGQPAVNLSSSFIAAIENPYKGLQAFTAADTLDFFGREKLMEKLAQRLGASRFLAVVGPSGSGKSSVVKAGLIPALWRGDLPGSDKWFVVDLLPGSRPLDQLEVALTRVAADQSANIGAHLARDANGLLRCADLILPKDGSELVVVIDQFEEVFTLLEDETQRQHLLDLLRAAVGDPRSRVRVVVTLRADFYDRPLRYPAFGDLLRNNMETILPLSVEELERAIVEPAKRVQVSYEPGLVTRIVGDVSYQAGALPLLQYALTELFDRREGLQITQQAYTDIGGAVGALAQRAEATYLEMTPEGQAATRQMFLRLVTLGEGVEDTRRRTPRGELLAIANDEDMMDEIIDMLAAYRLLALDHDADSRTPMVEVAHEAILREWERLRSWLDESRADIRLQRVLGQNAAEWSAHGQDVSYLLRGSRLEQFETWLAVTDVLLTPEERDHVQASVVERDRQIAVERQRQEQDAALQRRVQRVLQVLLVVFVLAAVISAGLALLANNERSRAEDAEYEALRQAGAGLAAQALTDLRESADPERAVLLALEALEQYPYTGQAESALASIVEGYAAHFDLIYAGQGVGPGSPNRVVWSPDGDRIASGGAFICLWDVQTGEQVATLRPETASLGNPAQHLAWSPVDNRIVFATSFIEVWDTHSGEQLMQIEIEPDRSVTGASWSPDALYLFTPIDDDTGIVWDAATGEDLLTFASQDDPILTGAWSPDGRYILTGHTSGLARLWDAKTGATLQILSGHAGRINSVAWSPDTKRAATASEDGTVRIWESETAKVLRSFAGHAQPVLSLDWSLQGKYITSLSTDTVKIWNAETGYVIFSQNLTANYPDVKWSPDGSYIATTENQGIRVWDAARQPLEFIGHTDIVRDVHWSPDGSRIVTSSADDTARVWDARTGEQLVVFDKHPGQGVVGGVGGLAWSPDGNYIASGSYQYARAWDTTTGEEKCVFDRYPFAYITSWSPDGTMIATGNEGVVYIYDAETCAFIIALENGEGCFAEPIWSPDSRRIVTDCTAGVSPVRVWDVASGEVLITFDEHEGMVPASDWSPDGTRIVTGGDDTTAFVWDAATGDVLLRFAGHADVIYDLDWSPDGTRIASGDSNGMVKVWDATGVEVMSFVVPGNGAFFVDWSPDGTGLAISSWLHTPIIRRAYQSTEELIAHAKECCVTRELTPEEREQFGLPVR